MWDSTLVTITKRAVGLVNSGQVKLAYNSSRFPSPGYTTVGIQNDPVGGSALVRNQGLNALGQPKNGTRSNSMQVFCVFNGITIPQGSVINSATLTQHIRNNQATAFKMGLKVADGTNLTTLWGTTPNNVSIYTNALTLKTNFGLQASPYIAGRPNWIRKVATPAVDELTTTTITTTGTVNQFPKEQVWDVKKFVQILVDKFDYNNGDMFFQIGPFSGAPGYYGLLEQNVYTDKNFTDTGIAPAVKGTPTSQGTGPLTPKLVIDFQGPVETPYLRSCRSVDALLVKRGADWGVCGDERFW